MGLERHGYVIFLFVMLVTLPTNVLAQVTNGWTTYVSDKCKVNFEYPTDFTLKVKQSPFDTNLTSEIELYNPELDLTGMFPSFSVGVCMDLEIMKQLMRTEKINPYVGQFLGNYTINDTKSLSMFSDSMISLASSALGLASTNFQINVVEDTRILPNFIDNEDAGIYSIIMSNSSTGKDSSKKVFSVLHNGMAYAFFYYDDLAKFESPANTQIRDRILNSIHFLD